MKYLRLLAVVGPILTCGFLDAGVKGDMKKLEKSNETRKAELADIKNQLNSLDKTIQLVLSKTDALDRRQDQFVAIHRNIFSLETRIEFLENLLSVESEAENHVVVPEPSKFPCFGSVKINE